MASPFDKHILVETLRGQLAAELERATRHALDAAEAATHEENRAESDKDMRSTETSYVARGQALRARELESALARLATMPIRDLGPDEPIEVSALVEVAQGRRSTVYLLVSAGGGERLRAGDMEIQTLATTSPLGAALLGLRAGDEAEVATPQGGRACTVRSVR